MVILYEINIFRIIDVPGCLDILPTSQGELALPSTGSWLPSRLSSTWRWVERIFPNLKYAQKAGHFKWKAGKRDGAKKREFTPESGTVDTYALDD